MQPTDLRDDVSYAVQCRDAFFFDLASQALRKYFDWTVSWSKGMFEKFSCMICWRSLTIRRILLAIMLRVILLRSCLCGHLVPCRNRVETKMHTFSHVVKTCLHIRIEYTQEIYVCGRARVKGKNIRVWNTRKLFQVKESLTLRDAKTCTVYSVAWQSVYLFLISEGLLTLRSDWCNVFTRSEKERERQEEKKGEMKIVLVC